MASIKQFENRFYTEEREVLVLTGGSATSCSRAGGETIWIASQFFLAYVDIKSDQLNKGDGRVVWPMSEKQYDERKWIRRFKTETVYRLRVRELKDKEIHEGILPSFCNQFLLVEIMEKDLEDPLLDVILQEYRTPVFLQDDQMGEFELDKELDIFCGRIDWLGKNISAYLDVNEDEKTWMESLSMMRKLYDDRQANDERFRQFAANELTSLANDWAEADGVHVAITAKSFYERMEITSLSVNWQGEYRIYYDDGDMFWGHAIVITGNLNSEPQAANIEG